MLNHTHHPTLLLARESLEGAWTYIEARSSKDKKTYRCAEPGRQNVWAHIQRDAGGWAVDIVELSKPGAPR